MAPRNTPKHVRFSDDDELVYDDRSDVPGHRGLSEGDIDGDSVESVEQEYDDEDDYENEYADDEDLAQSADVLDELLDVMNTIQQSLVTSDGTAIADVLASIATSLRVIAKAVVPVQKK